VGGVKAAAPLTAKVEGTGRYGIPWKALNEFSFWKPLMVFRIPKFTAFKRVGLIVQSTAVANVEYDVFPPPIKIGSSGYRGLAGLEFQWRSYEVFQWMLGVIW
jgi:hypothetical protein